MGYITWTMEEMEDMNPLGLEVVDPSKEKDKFENSTRSSLDFW